MKKREIVLFIGPPGSGKGSLSQLCVKRLGWRQLSTGNLCRQHIARATDIGQQIDLAIKSGKLISDDLMVSMVEEWLMVESSVTTVIFDGFPRTVRQAEALHDLLSSREDLQLKLIRLAIPQEELLYRLLARSICENEECQQVYSMHKHSRQTPDKEMICNECQSKLIRRSDDEEAAIAERLRIYLQHEQGLVSFFERVGQPVKDVEASLPLEEVYERFLDTAGYADV